MSMESEIQEVYESELSESEKQDKILKIIRSSIK